MDMTKVEDWLAGIPSKSTRKSYINGVKTFEEFYGKGIETLIGDKKAGKVIEKFFVWLKEKKELAQNTARVKANAVIQFLKYFDTPVKYRKSIGIYRTEISTRDHRLTVSELQEMGSVASLTEQAILQVFLLGLRVSDASKLEWEQFDVIDQEAPIPIEIMTRKEGQLAKSFITQEFKEILEKYLKTIDKKNKYLLQSSRKGHLDDETLNWKLKDLAKRADVKLRGNLHWHCGRKLFMRTCAELGINQWNAKMMVGKAVSKDILTYVNGVNLAKDFIKVSNVLRLNRASVTNKLGDLEDILEKVGIAFVKSITKMAREQLRNDGLISLATNEELDPMKDWLKIIENYIVFDEIIPPTPERKQPKKAEERGAKDGMS